MSALRRITAALGLVALIGGGGLLWLDRPSAFDATPLSGLEGDAGRGEAVFWASGCASCHAAPGAQGEARLVLAGGTRLVTEFGTFIGPNISPDPVHGIGGWTVEDMARALWQGVSPEGRGYFPAFPYTSYRLMRAQDVADLWAFLLSLPASDRPDEAHDLPLWMQPRLGLGLWNRLHLTKDWAVGGDLTREEARGRYLAEALAHCAECHTPRGATGGLRRDRWLAGAPNPTGEGSIPALTPDRLDWSVAQIAGYLDLGLTPAFDTAGGTMASVVANLHQISAEDRRAIALYLKRVPPAD